jgi:ComF family protein
MKSAQDLWMPDLCVLCAARIEQASFCASCRYLLREDPDTCPRCAARLPAAQPPGTACGRCQHDPPPFDKAVSAVGYRFPIDLALKKYKFDGQLYFAPAFASLLLPLLQTHFEEADALVPVPLHWLRHARRGFNQATEICKPLSRSSGLPTLRKLHRVRATPSQSGLDAAARRRNLRRAFVLRGSLRSRHPVIIDDVMTTGETCRQLAHVLRDAGAESVGVLVVARA